MISECNRTGFVHQRLRNFVKKMTLTRFESFCEKRDWSRVSSVFNVTRVESKSPKIVTRVESFTMGVIKGGQDFEHFSKKGYSYFQVGKNKYHHFCPPPEIFWKNLLVPPPGKNPSDAHVIDSSHAITTNWAPKIQLCDSESDERRVYQNKGMNMM